MMRAFYIIQDEKERVKNTKVLTSSLTSRGFVILCCPLVDIVAYDKIMYLTAVPLMTTTQL